MLRVEIGGDNNAWVDHVGNRISKLVFSNDSETSGPVAYPGHYPLESAGALYRNIDNFRESYLQSQTDLEIRVPTVYSQRGLGFQTLDLLYWLECVNEAEGKDFSLIGSSAMLYLDGAHIYKGVVSSYSSGSIRISDWLGSPVLPVGDFPAGIGVPAAKWPVIVTRERNCVRLKVSDVPLSSKPEFYIKLGEEFVEVSRLLKNRKMISTTDYSYPWMEANISVIMNFSGLGIFLASIKKDEPFVIPRASLVGRDMLEVLRPDPDKETPDYYEVSHDSNYEIVEAWSNAAYDQDHISLGRARLGDDARNFFTPPGEIVCLIKKCEDTDIGLLVSRMAYAESIVYKQTSGVPAHTSGDPAEMAWISRSSSQFLSDSHFPPFIEFGYKSSGKFTINLSATNLPPDAEIFSATAELRMEYTNVIAYLEVGELRLKLPSVLNQAEKKCHTMDLTFESPAKPADLEKISFSFAYDTQSSSYNVRVKLIAVRIFVNAQIPLGDKKLYASGKPEGESYTPEGKPVWKLASSLTTLAGRHMNPQMPVGFDLDGDQIKYGTVLSGSSVSLRDMLRSLSAESCTLMKFNPYTHINLELIDFSLGIDRQPTRIGMDAIALAGNKCSLKLESPDRSELISSLEIRWGKNFDTGKYEHAFSVDAAILSDGGQYAPNVIAAAKWASVIAQMQTNKGIGLAKSIEARWIMNSEGAENMAYNLLRWNTAPMRKAQAVCILTEIRELGIDIGSFVAFDLPGYHQKFAETSWIVTGVHDDFDSMATTLELLEVRGMPAVPPERFLLLEDGENILTENMPSKLKMEDFYG